MKKHLSFLLALVIIFIPFFEINNISFASSVTTYTDGYYSYTVVDSRKNTVEITKYSGKESTVNIPEILSSNYTVVSLAISSFSDNNYIKIVNIPSTVTKIDALFRNDTNLKAINVSDDNKYYSSIDGVLYDKTNETLIRCPQAYPQVTFVVPDSVKTIGDYAFYYSPYSTTNVENLLHIEIPNGVETISTGAFYCSFFQEIVLPDSVETIGNSVFLNSQIETLHIGKGLKSIGTSCFGSSSGSYAEKLKEITVSKENTIFSSVDGVLLGNYGKDLIRFPTCKSLDSYTVPDSVTTLKENSFSWVFGIKQIDLNNVETLEKYALWNFYATEIITSKNLTSFSMCPSSTSFTIKVMNKDCSINFELNNMSKYNITVYGYDNSLAQEFCKNANYSYANFTFVLLDEDDEKNTDNTDNSEKPIVHNYYANIVEPTCEEMGYTKYVCSECGSFYKEDYTQPLGHKIVTDEAVEPTCTTDGKTQGNHCLRCDKVFEQQEIIKAKGHQYTTVVTKATFDKSGSVKTICSVCNYVKSKTTVAKIKSVTISKSSYTYTGKNITKPSVTVKDSNNKLIDSSYYSVTYISRSTNKTVNSIKDIGQYKVKVVFKDRYSATKYLYFSVKPNKIAVNKLTTSNKTITANWSKEKSVTGYQILIATDSDFTKNTKTVTISKNSTTSYKFTKLKKGTKYYIKIRSYKTIKVDGKMAKMYSDYSSAKSIKCK
jgi:hypothetical protein